MNRDDAIKLAQDKYLTTWQDIQVPPQNSTYFETKNPSRSDRQVRSINMAAKDQKTAAGFTSYYLQQSTKEFAEDLDKIRSADDFKGDALPMLVKSLQQGTSMFSAVDQKRIVDAQRAGASEKRSDSEEEST
ncbi:hypothetical protein NUW58_g3003 [Xylaria curta]|uniref:Uncharacterized protein n=1 Tax=Xylaria curta TaxID=42375 RepID=A0ACC1PDH2_9PEZI|nr:hypothetical protein NUW58_g3003 [Xylaria curta]